MSQGTRTLLGMAVGALVGWLAGDAIAVLQPFAAACLLLMQMPVIPYLVLSLIDGLGRLTPETLRRLARAGGVAILVIWGISLATVFMAGTVFPQGSGAFFADPEAGAGQPVNLVNLLIPNNPFDALARTVVPAIVFFCLFFVAELVHVPGREAFLDAVGAANKAIERVTSRINKAAPYMVAILMAVSVGTLGPSFFHRMEIFSGVFTFACALLALWLIPMLVSMTTPVSYKELLGRTFGAMSLAFTTGSNMVALPLIIQAARELTSARVEDGEAAHEQDDAVVETVIPVLTNIPNAGNLVAILLVPFTAASYGIALTAVDYFQVSTGGVLSLFGSAGNALRFMMEQCELPTDVVALYTAAQSVLARPAALAKVSSIMALTLWIAFAVQGKLRIRPLGLAGLMVGTLLPLLLASVLVSRELPPPQMEVAWSSMSLPSMVQTTFVQASSLRGDDSGALDRIRRAGVIRVGFFENSLPYSYRNRKGELVGYHAAMAQQLAQDLGCGLVMVSTTHATFVEDLLAGRIDVLMGPVGYEADRLLKTSTTLPYMTVRSALTVRDSQQRGVESRVQAGQTAGLRIGVLEESPLGNSLDRLLPGAIAVPLEEPQEMLSRTDLDAVLWHDVEAFAWSTTHAGFGVVALPKPVTRALSLPLRRSDGDFKDALQSWIEMRKADGTLEGLYHTWIMGKSDNATPPQPSGLIEMVQWIERH